MILQIEEMPKTRIAYMRHIGPYGENNKALMETLKNWAASNHLLHNDAVILGIARDNPAMTPPKECRYDVCIVVSEDSQINDPSVSQDELSGGRYAVFTLRHTAQDIQKAWNGIFPELSRQGYRIDAARPILERYIPRMVNRHLCEICVPVY